MKPLLLCTDLDRTLIPNGAQPESPQARPLFARLASCREVTLAYVTGRHLGLIEEAIETFDLPTPDYAIADVGATLYRSGVGRWQRWKAWDARISPDWAGASHAELCVLLRDFAELHLQEPQKQSRHKLSFYVPLTVDVQRLIAQVQARLSEYDISVNLIWSIDEATHQGLLDILPARANKLRAIEFLMQARGFLREQVVFAGDSGNDLDVLLSNIPAVLVTNADPTLKAQLADAPGDSLYLARGGHLGMNGNYSAGILEGLAHYRADVRQWLAQEHERGFEHANLPV